MKSGKMVWFSYPDHARMGRRPASTPLPQLLLLFLLAWPLSSTGSSTESVLDALDERATEPGKDGRRRDSGIQAHRNINNAMGHFSQAIRADPSDPSNYFQLRHALFLDDRRAETAAISLDILDKFPHLCNTMTFHFDTAMSLFGAHRRKEAFLHLVRSIGLPEDKNKVAPMFASSEYDTLIRTLHHIGMLLEEAGMPIDAARAIMVVNRLDHREIKYNPYLVSALISAGKVSEAVAAHDYSKAVGGGIQPPLIQGIEGWKVPGVSRRLNAWEGMLYHLWGQRGQVYERPFGEPLKVPANQEGARKVAHDHLWRLQNPERCSDAHVLVYSFKDSYAGFGAEIHGLMLALNMAYALNRTLVMPRKDDWWYTRKETCQAQGLTCYFDQISSCWEDETDPARRMAFNYTASMDLRGSYPAYTAAHGGLIFWRSAMAKYIMRPNRAMRDRLERLKRVVQWRGSGEGATVALHIRRGDRGCGRRQVQVETYVAAALAKFEEVGGKGSLLLCTEDKSVLNAVVHAVETRDEWKNVRLMYDPAEARNSIENSRNLVISHEVDMHEYALSAIANLMLMAECNHQVLAFHSHFGRLAYELSYGLGSAASPPLSMDVMWINY